MTKKELKGFAQQLLNLTRKLDSAKSKTEKKELEMKIELLTEEILEAGGTIEDLLKIDELIQKKI